MVRILLILLVLLLSTNSYGMVELDGDDDEVQCGDSIDIDGTDFTIAFWFKSDSWDLDAGDYNSFIVKRETFALMEWSIYYNNTGDGNAEGLTIAWGNSFANTWYSGLTPAINTWHSVVLTRDGNDWDFYVDATDGVSDAGTTDAAAIPAGNEDVVIGNLQKDLAGQRYHLDGKMSDVAVWTNNLTTSEIAQYASARQKRIAFQLQPTNLHRLWLLDDTADGTTNQTYREHFGGTSCTGINGATTRAEEVLSY